MAGRRKRHVQQELFRVGGGKKGRSGRKPKGKRAGSPHKRRPDLKPYQPVHITLRVAEVVGNLRKRFMYTALREATIAVALRELNYKETGAFRIVHISIQRNHVHLICEADHKMALSRGLQSFQISAAKHINRAASRKLSVRRRGSVFPDRFHQEIITSPRQARHSLSYVLNNWRKHREDRGELQSTWNVDPFSTGALFEGWKALENKLTYWKLRDGYEPMVVYLPTSWLLRVGWRKHGLIEFDEVPSTPSQMPHRSRALAAQA